MLAINESIGFDQIQLDAKDIFLFTYFTIVSHNLPPPRVYKVHIVGRGVEEISVRVQAKIRETRLREAFKKKMSQIAEKVHNFLDPPPLGSLRLF